jgi:hypothetical protein
MGCPFALGEREPEIRARVERFADAYAAAGLSPTFVFADWEIDGALEWNGAWDAARRCRRCRASIAEIGDFAAFQRSVREVRSRLQRVCFAEPLLARFPDVLVGNYGVYPHGGLRTWYDYFEELPAGAPTVPDGRAPPGLPLIPFVHWQPVAERGSLPPGVVPLSEPAYREVLWHVLLRGAPEEQGRCAAADTLRELGPVHEVYRQSLRYAGILARGKPVCFDVPTDASPLVSAVLEGPRLLARRSDFAAPGGSCAVVDFDSRQ